MSPSPPSAEVGLSRQRTRLGRSFSFPAPGWMEMTAATVPLRPRRSGAIPDRPEDRQPPLPPQKKIRPLLLTRKASSSDQRGANENDGISYEEEEGGGGRLPKQGMMVGRRGVASADSTQTFSGGVVIEGIHEIEKCLSLFVYSDTHSAFRFLRSRRGDSNRTPSPI